MSDESSDEFLPENQLMDCGSMACIGISNLSLNHFLDRKEKKITQNRKNICKFGINTNELVIFSRDEYRLAYEKSRTRDHWFS